MSGTRSHADVRVLHWTALAAADRAVRVLRAADLDRRSPCEPWTVRMVLRHTVGHNRGLASQLEGRPHDLGIWEGLDLGIDPRSHWWDSARRVVAASTARTHLNEMIYLPGVGTVSLARALGIHAGDLLAHAWDLAVACGAGPAFRDDDPYRQAANWLDGTNLSWLSCARLAPASAVDAAEQGAAELLTRLGRTVPAPSGHGLPELRP
jgi:uncharacterized protein (TIGR03086 family)